MNSPNAEPGSIPNELPVLPVSNVVLFPFMGAPLIVGRPSSIVAVETALATDRLVAVFLQREASQENPGVDDLYQIGTAAVILKMVHVPPDAGLQSDVIHVLVRGVERVRATEWLPPPKTEGAEGASNRRPHLRVRIEPLKTPYEKTQEIEALVSSLLAIFSSIVDLSPNIPDEAKFVAAEIDDYGKLADYVASIINMDVKAKQEILETLDVRARLERMNALASEQRAILELAVKIQKGTQVELDKMQREYILRQQLKEIQKELGEGDERAAELDELKEKIEQAQMPEEARKAAEHELERLRNMPPQAAEYTVARTYLDWLVSVPWSKSTEDNLDLKRAQQILDEDHYDLADVKDRILEHLAVRKLKPDAKGTILCFVGPPGVGKTSLGRSIARAMGRAFVRVSLGGVRDEAEIRGHRRTYIGALPGRIIQGIKTAGSNNPVFMLDEIDKLGSDFRGDPSSALLEVLDPQQNKAFSDHYLDVPFDLSKVFFIATANILDTVPPALRDRMEVLRLPGYTEDEKVVIAEKYLIPRQMEEQGLSAEHIAFTMDAVRTIIRDYTREAGVRNLEREIANICRKVARAVAESDGQFEKRVIEPSAVATHLGPRKFEREIGQTKGMVGVATGLAWTQFGGSILFIETAKMKGGHKLQLTGQLGDVMQESAHTALSYVRAHADSLGIDPDFFDKHDIHIHVPEGSTPKDGPSAGVAIAVALASLATEHPARHDVAMTGEISLIGRVLPVGGIKEKVLAAHQAGIRKVILPRRNQSDVEEIPEEIRRDIEFVFVDDLSEVLSIALEPAAVSESAGQSAR